MVRISPVDFSRRRLVGHGIIAELVQSTRRERIEFRYRGSSHLLVAWEQGKRSDGETCIEDTPRSTLRNVTRKLSFVPAGRDYFEWHQPRSATRLMYFYIDAAGPEVASSPDVAEKLRAPRVFFEDAVLWTTVLKLKGLIGCPAVAHRAYFAALGAVLVQELVRSDRGSDSIESSIRGGLAAWQQRIVAAYIEEHLAEQIPLATLALRAVEPVSLQPCVQAIVWGSAASLSHKPTHRVRQGTVGGADANGDGHRADLGLQRD